MDEIPASSKPVGLSADAGWQAGVRRTIAAPLPAVWAFLLGEGVTTWLGDTELAPVRGAHYETADGITGDIRSHQDGVVLRLTTKRPGRATSSTVQLRVIAAATGTTIAFHEERLGSQADRDAALARWRSALDRIADALT